MEFIFRPEFGLREWLELGDEMRLGVVCRESLRYTKHVTPGMLKVRGWKEDEELTLWHNASEARELKVPPCVTTIDLSVYKGVWWEMPPNLKRLAAIYVDDFPPIPRLPPSLTWLLVGNLWDHDCSHFRDLKELKYLWITGPVANFDFLPELTSLTELRLTSLPGLEDMPPLPPNLKTLTLEAAPVLTVLIPFMPTSLEVLRLGKVREVATLPGHRPTFRVVFSKSVYEEFSIPGLSMSFEDFF